MKKYLVVVIILLHGFASYGQYNLVPNYSFEDNVICPSINNNPLPAPWYLPQNVPNKSAYLNACSTYPPSTVPNVNTGFQYAKTGSGYAELDLYNPGFFDNRFYIQTQLKQTLVLNKCYYGEFWVSLNNISRTAINNMAMLVTDTAIRSAGSASGPNFGYDLIPANPQIWNYGNLVIRDTLNWVKVSGIYTAHGGENFITIGNFKDDNNTQQVQVNNGPGTSAKAGYYIDDIRLTPLDSMVLKADAGEDRSITTGNSTYIGSYTNGLTNVTWFNSLGISIATGVPGLNVSPASSTFYMVEQTVCGQYSRDTVYVNVGAVPLQVTDYGLQIADYGKQVKNNWTTVNEINVSHFNVQRSSDGTNFQTIQQTAAKNSSYNEYSFVDRQPLAGTSYYRLQAVDKDGKITYSKILSIALSIKPSALSIYPNPARGKVNIVCNIAINEVVVSDLMGRVVMRRQLNQLLQQELDIALPQGIYLLKVLGNDGAWQAEKLVVE